MTTGKQPTRPRPYRGGIFANIVSEDDLRFKPHYLPYCECPEGATVCECVPEELKKRGAGQ